MGYPLTPNPQETTNQWRNRIRWRYYGLKGTLTLAMRTMNAIAEHPMSTAATKEQCSKTWEALHDLDKLMETRIKLKGTDQ